MMKNSIHKRSSSIARCWMNNLVCRLVNNKHMIIFINNVQWHIFWFCCQRLQFSNRAINFIPSFHCMHNLINDAAINSDESRTNAGLNSSSAHSINTRRDPRVESELPGTGFHGFL
nr:hypothetical protein Iba_chr10aCG3440 [Ipomoea batatas]